VLVRTANEVHQDHAHPYPERKAELLASGEREREPKGHWVMGRGATYQRLVEEGEADLGGDDRRKEDTP